MIYLYIYFCSFLDDVANDQMLVQPTWVADGTNDEGAASAEVIELQEFHTSGMPDGSDANRLEVGPLISECKLILTLEFKS